MTMQRIIIPGGSGFLGRQLAKYFKNNGYQVVILSRQEFHSEDATVVLWDGKSLGSWCQELENSLAVINLAGRSVDCRYHAKNRQVLLDSRILSTKILGLAIANCVNKPKVWLNSSTATLYEHTYGEGHSENGKIAASPDAKDEFSIELANAWEKAFNESISQDIRKVLLRTAIVFGNDSGTAYQIIKRLVGLGLGGRMGHGKQYVSWIHSNDFCRALEWIIINNQSNGIYNISAPNPLTNKLMMQIIRKKLGVPFGLPATKWMLEIGAFFLRTETELIIKSRRVLPTRLLSEGFEFQFTNFIDMIEDLEK